MNFTSGEYFVVDVRSLTGFTLSNAPLSVDGGRKRVDEMVELTSDLIHAGANGPSASGFSYAQLRVLGVSTPPRKGWLSNLVGKRIARSQYEKFLSLRKRK